MAGALKQNVVANQDSMECGVQPMPYPIQTYTQPTKNANETKSNGKMKRVLQLVVNIYSSFYHQNRYYYVHALVVYQLKIFQRIRRSMLKRCRCRRCRRHHYCRLRRYSAATSQALI